MTFLPNTGSTYERSIPLSRPLPPSDMEQPHAQLRLAPDLSWSRIQADRVGGTIMVGLTTQSDVQSATAQVGGLQAQLPQFDAQIAQAMNGLAVVVG
jgi:hypothetical protein